MTLETLKNLSEDELNKLADMFDDKSVTTDQIKNVIGADDFSAKMRFICSLKTAKRVKRTARCKAAQIALTRNFTTDRSKVSVVSEFC